MIVESTHKTFTQQIYLQKNISDSKVKFPTFLDTFLEGEVYTQQKFCCRLDVRTMSLWFFAFRSPLGCVCKKSDVRATFADVRTTFFGRQESDVAFATLQRSRFYNACATLSKSVL